MNIQTFISQASRSGFAAYSIADGVPPPNHGYLNLKYGRHSSPEEQDVVKFFKANYRELSEPGTFIVWYTGRLFVGTWAEEISTSDGYLWYGLPGNDGWTTAYAGAMIG